MPSAGQATTLTYAHTLVQSQRSLPSYVVTALATERLREATRRTKDLTLLYCTFVNQSGTYNYLTDPIQSCTYQDTSAGELIPIGARGGSTVTCTTADPSGGCGAGCDPTIGCELATQPGLPHGKCSVGSPEYAVGDTLVPKDGPNTDVTDENYIIDGGVFVGIMYKGSNHNIYVAPYLGNQTGYSLGISWHSITIGFSSPTGWGPVVEWNGMLDPGSSVNKCWQDGELIPGTKGSA